MMGYQRLTQVTRPDGTQDTYYYDTYSDGFMSVHAGRLAAVTFQGRPDPNNSLNARKFTYMYSYTQGGRSRPSCCASSGRKTVSTWPLRT